MNMVVACPKCGKQITLVIKGQIAWCERTLACRKHRGPMEPVNVLEIPNG